jgi:hypothetical protein
LTTYYVDAVDGNDANDGLSEGSGNAWQTLGQAESVIAPGDIVYVKGNAVYAETLTLSVNGLNTAPVYYVGYTTTPGDNGIATINPPSGTGITSNFTVKNFRFWFNFRITDATIGYDDSTGDQNCMVNCEVDNCSSHGVNADNGWVFWKCSFHDNGGDGVTSDVGTIFYQCIGYNNVGDNFQALSPQCIDTIGYNLTAGTKHLNVDGSGNQGYMAIQNTIDGDSSVGNAGISLSVSNPIIVANNILTNCVTGIDRIVGSGDELALVEYNSFYNNTTDVDANLTDRGNNQTTDPLFTDQASRDYTITSSSPCVDNASQPRTS